MFDILVSDAEPLGCLPVVPADEIKHVVDARSTAPNPRALLEVLVPDRVCLRVSELKKGQRALRFVRGRRDDQVVLTTSGRSSGFCIDPIEKTSLNHFLLGTSVLSFATAGCNSVCRCCQDRDISKSGPVDMLADSASPHAIAKAKEWPGTNNIGQGFSPCHSTARTIAIWNVHTI